MSASFFPHPSALDFFSGARGPLFSEEVVRPTADNAPIPLIAVCHLSWDWVWQRPQQFISRLAAARPVLFVQTHCTATAEAFTRHRAALNHPNVTILEMHLPAHRWGDGAFIDEERRRVLQEVLAGEFRGRFDRPILWINDPMAAPAFVGHLGERLVVYDCMDELTQFQGAPAGMVERERELTQKADLVFCGGQKMRTKRLPLNPRTYFYGTGVDCGHFGQALQPEFPVDEDIRPLAGPVLGYFGVIDERIDYPLIAALADTLPGCSLAMVGPIAKVDPATLPRRKNLHWLGGKPYGRLPAIAKGFAVSLMPFALNAATEFINPTKALEYMAAGRPVVSTAISEVKTNFGAVAHIASDHSEFIAFCEREAVSPSRARIRRGIKLAAAHTWDAIAAEMEWHIQRALGLVTAVVPVTVPAVRISERRAPLFELPSGLGT